MNHPSTRPLFGPRRPAVNPAALADIEMGFHGSIILVTGLTPDGSEWLAEHLPEDAPRMGAAFAVEHRFISDIANGMLEHGLRLRRA